MNIEIFPCIIDCAWDYNPFLCPRKECPMSLKAFIIYVTKCGHTTRLPVDVQLGHPFSCLVCHKQTTITDIHTLEWHAKCNYRRCHFGAWTGLSQDLAEQAATRHLRNAGNHDGQVITEYVQNPEAVKRLAQLKRNHIL